MGEELESSSVSLLSPALMQIREGIPNSYSATKGDLLRAKTEAFMHRTGCVVVHHFLIRVVRSPYLDISTMFLISLNAIVIGFQTNFLAAHPGSKLSEPYRHIETTFCVLFTLEIFIRLYGFRWNFFTMQSYRWNIFDLLVVGIQLIEQVIGAGLETSTGLPVTVSVLRTLRILRLMRIIRVIRLLRYFAELRTMISAISGSLKPLCSVISLFVMLIYVLSVFFTQLVFTYIVNTDSLSLQSEEQMDAIRRFYGSVAVTSLALWQSLSGGLDWSEVIAPVAALNQQLYAVLCILFSLFVAFALLALMNIVTGVFVETAMRKGREDEDHFLINNVRALFQNVYGDSANKITWEDFEAHLDEKVMQDYFLAIDVDRCEAQGVFQLLDISDKGYIDADEFLSGCIRLRGPARSLDLQLLMRESCQTSRIVNERLWSLEKALMAYMHSPAMGVMIDRGSSRLKASTSLD